MCARRRGLPLKEPNPPVAALGHDAVRSLVDLVLRVSRLDELEELEEELRAAGYRAPNLRMLLLDACASGDARTILDRLPTRALREFLGDDTRHERTKLRDLVYKKLGFRRLIIDTSLTDLHATLRQARETAATKDQERLFGTAVVVARALEELLIRICVAWTYMVVRRPLGEAACDWGLIESPDRIEKVTLGTYLGLLKRLMKEGTAVDGPLADHLRACRKDLDEIGDLHGVAQRRNEVFHAGQRAIDRDAPVRSARRFIELAWKVVQPLFAHCREYLPVRVVYRGSLLNADGVMLAYMNDEDGETRSVLTKEHAALVPGEEYVMVARTNPNIIDPVLVPLNG